MINKEDLRIGNIVNYGINQKEGGITLNRGVITALTENKAIVNNIAIKYCNLYPITFNETMLNLIGFYHDATLIGVIKNTFRYKNSSIALNVINSIANQITAYENIYKEYVESIIQINCNYLHELQNCYYFIAKTELELNNIL